MAKLSTVALKGKSGEVYVFDVWLLGQPFKALGAIYAVTRRYQDEGTYKHDVIYIGETNDLSTRFDDHHKAGCYMKHGANCICTYLDVDEDARLARERDLVQSYKPKCND